MKTHLMAFMLGVCATLWLARYVWRPAVALTPTVQAQEIPPRGRACGSGALAGAYSFSLLGETVSGNNEGPYGALGILTLDNVGGAALVVTQNYNGTIAPTITTLGRYTVGNDCVGTLLLNSGARFDFVASDSGREINLMQLVQGGVIQGIAKRQ